METIVVNLLGGPCCGKSTVAAGVFYKLKCLNYQTEIAFEVAKDNCWDEAYKKLEDQIYVFGKQYHRIKRLLNKVKYCIAESPMLLSIVYKNEELSKSKYFDDFIIEQIKCLNNKFYFIDRPQYYTEVGRNHTLSESLKIDEQILNLLEKYNLPYKRFSALQAVDFIVNDLISNYNDTSN